MEDDELLGMAGIFGSWIGWLRGENGLLGTKESFVGTEHEETAFWRVNHFIFIVPVDK